MKRILTAALALILCLSVLLPVTALASENPVPEAKKAVICIKAGIYYDDNGQPRTYDGYYGSGTGFGVGLPGEYANTFVTNCHVVADDDMKVYDQVYIFIDGADIYDRSTVIEAKVLYADPEVDLAIIQTEKPVSGVTTLPLLPAETMETGDGVYAMGFPSVADKVADFNNFTVEDITVTDGVLSRYLVSYGVKSMAHTATVNHGNSGGPLINEKGQVIGINSFIYYDGKTPDLRSYAIYIDYAMEQLDQLGITYTDASKVTEEEEPAKKETNLGLILGIAAAAVVILVLVVVLVKKGGKAAYTLCAVAGPLQGMTWPVKKAVTVGRDPSCTVAYPGGTNGVSRNHCRIEVKNGQVTVTDLGSSYGTYVGGRKLSPNVPVAIRQGTEICIGGEQVRLVLR